MDHEQAMHENNHLLTDEDLDDDKIAAEENLLNEHLSCVKEEAQLIT